MISYIAIIATTIAAIAVSIRAYFFSTNNASARAYIESRSIHSLQNEEQLNEVMHDTVVKLSNFHQLQHRAHMEVQKRFK